MTVDARFWDNLADKYSRKPVDDPAAFERKKEITKARLGPTHVIADIGCGTGSLALELAPLVAQVHAVDFSSRMVEIGRGKAEAAGITNVTFHQAVAQEPLPFEPGSLDGICAYSILHLVHERAELLKQFMTLLKPGGFFISSTVCLRESPVPYRPILAVMRWLGKAPEVELLKIEGVLQEIRDAGFTDVSLRDVGAEKIIAFIEASKPG